MKTTVMSGFVSMSDMLLGLSVGLLVLGRVAMGNPEDDQAFQALLTRLQATERRIAELQTATTVLGQQYLELTQAGSATPVADPVRPAPGNQTASLR